ncbi:glycosyltransferase [Vibrio ostreae]|uniref:Glycosyltransferase n=1 Tax=Vibrio ostreae TaxID=2841925 RepID=A0A975UB26_9VIBR|nr:glycosyltransferase [Vibrio ostreae]QXO17234.1 glycosyltransferase [Vibrio ostreae]
MIERVAVAISVYTKDKPEYVKESLDSLYNQDYKSIDIFLNVDGNISKELRSLLTEYEEKDNFHIKFFEKNLGLAFQLNDIISRVFKLGSFSYLARMDADDVCEPHRITKQVEYFRNNNNVSVLGTSVIEFGANNKKFYKKMPTSHKDLSDNIIKRCPFNHPTVMFNLSHLSICDLKYNSELKNTQDYFLWVDLMSKGYVFANLDLPLLRFRVDEKFHSRRGLTKAKNDLLSRFYAMKKLRRHNFLNWFYTISLFALRLSPSFLKRIAYNYLR